MIITLDIETVRLQSEDLRGDVLAGVRPPAALKKPESIAAWERDERAAAEQEAIERTSFDGGYGQVCCIGWAIDDQPSESVQVADLSADAEQDMLGQFVSAMRQAYAGTSGSRPLIVGHNVIAFDLAFLWKRCIVRQVRPPNWLPRNPKPWSEYVADTMLLWAGDRGTISLDRLCRILGVDGKGDGPTGADVWPMAQAGQFGAIADYCRADVDRARSVYRRMVFA
jgi:hypothetical protein